MIGISKIGNDTEWLSEMTPLASKPSKGESAAGDGSRGGSAGQEQQQSRRSGADDPEAPASAAVAPASPAEGSDAGAGDGGGRPPMVDEAIEQLGADIRARIFAALWQSRPDGSDLGQAAAADEAGKGAPRIEGSGRDSDRDKYLYRDGSWLNVATGESGAPTVPRLDAGPDEADAAPGHAGGTGRFGDLNRYVFRDGAWYNLSTGEPGTPAPSGGGEGRQDAESRDAVNAAALFHRLGFDPMIQALADGGIALVAIARENGTPEPPAPARHRAGRANAVSRIDTAFRDRYAAWIAAGGLDRPPVSIAADEEFASAWQASHGAEMIGADQIQAFLNPRTREILIRRHAKPAVNAAYRETILHDLAYAHRSERFAAIFGAYRLSGNAAASLCDAAAEYLAFKVYAPERFSGAQGGYAGYLKRKSGIRRTAHDAIVLHAEAALEAMGPDLQAAYFHGDPAAMARLAALARSIVAMKAPGTFRAEAARGGGTPAPLSSSVGRLGELLHRVAADGRDVSPRSIHRHHRRPDALQSLLPEGDTPLIALGRIRDASLGRPGGASMLSLTMQLHAAPLIAAILQGNPRPDYTVFRAADDGFQFTRAGADPARIAHRISINARQAHAGAVLDVIIREVLDEPRGFPGVIAAMISGPFSGASRTDNLVVYLESERDRGQVLGHLARYERAHPSHFLSETPKLAMPYLPGISYAEEPSLAMKRSAAAIVEAEGLPARNAQRYGFGSLRAHAIYLAYRDATAMPREAGSQAGFVDAFRWKVWERFVQFGVNPDEPALNLRGV